MKFFIRFAGFDHGGHTLLAAFLDAHPNVAILQGYHETKTIGEFLQRRHNQTNAFKKKEGLPYGYAIEGQGTWTDIRCIGTTNISNPSYDFGLKNKYLTSVRNPRWVINALWRKTINRTKSDDHLRDAINNIEMRAKWIEILEENKCVYLEEWNTDPEFTLRDLCKYLELPFCPDWAAKCIEIIDLKAPQINIEWGGYHLGRLETLLQLNMFRRYQ